LKTSLKKLENIFKKTGFAQVSLAAQKALHVLNARLPTSAIKKIYIATLKLWMMEKRMVDVVNVTMFSNPCKNLLAEAYLQSFLILLHC